MWKIEYVKYDMIRNAVRYRVFKVFDSFREAEKYFMNHQLYPICLFHRDCMSLINPGFAMFETEVYKDEVKKIID